MPPSFYSPACVHCNKKKIKCNTDAGTNICTSCLTLRIECIPRTRKKRDPKVRKSPATSVNTTADSEVTNINREPRASEGGPSGVSAQTSPPGHTHRQGQSQDTSVNSGVTNLPSSWHDGASSSLMDSRHRYDGGVNELQPSPGHNSIMDHAELNRHHSVSIQGPTFIGRAHYLENGTDIDENTARSYTPSRANGLSEPEFATLQIWNSLDLPPRSLSQSLIEAFMEYCFPWMPTVETGEMLLSRNQVSSYLLMQSVFLAASRVSPSPGLAEYATSQELYQRARALFWVAHEQDPLTVVKSITMLHWYNPDGPAHVSYDTSEYWLKIGVGLAYQIGLHKEPPNGPQRAIRRRIWWSLVVRDAMISVSRGRPRAINLEDSDISPPSMDDFVDIPHAGELFLPYVGICRLLGDLVEICSRKRAVEPTRRLQAENMLFRWIRTLPERLRLSELSPHDNTYFLRPHDLKARQLHVPYFICVSILALSGNPSKTVAAAGIISASFVAGIYEDFLARDQVKHLQPIFTTFCLISGLLLMSIRPWPDLWNAAQPDLEVIQKCLKELSNRWKSAIGASKALQKAISSPMRPLQQQQILSPLSSDHYSLFEGFSTDLCRMYVPCHSTSLRSSTIPQDWTLASYQNPHQALGNAMGGIENMSSAAQQMGYIPGSTDDFFMNPEYEGLTNWFLSDWTMNSFR